jgi:hypothetical protein
VQAGQNERETTMNKRQEMEKRRAEQHKVNTQYHAWMSEIGTDKNSPEYVSASKANTNFMSECWELLGEIKKGKEWIAINEDLAAFIKRNALYISQNK